MLSYQHIYHAGNMADVQKHLWLIAVLDELRRQDKPFTWIDTHAGRGLYDLQSPEAQKLAEYKTGLFKIIESMPNTKNAPAPLQIYQKIIKELNKAKELRHYPGSAMIAAKMLRANDNLFAFDMHPQEYKYLVDALRNYQFVKTEKANGYEKLATLAPPRSGCGGALIDPSYEIKKEYETVGIVIKDSLKLWPQGIFMIWYPMLKAGLHEKLKDACQTLDTPHIIDEWIWGEAQTTKGLYGSGMIIFNAPDASKKMMQDIKKML